MGTRYLINTDGTPFESTELGKLRNQLDVLNETDRLGYRNSNAAEIAKLEDEQVLIISGPGTGKSHLFLQRINEWFKQHAEAKVLVTTFVRKLVADLQSDIEKDKLLTSEQKTNVTVSTLHRLARSIVEHNGGTSEWPFEKYIRVIGQSWKKVVWDDVLSCLALKGDDRYNWGKFESQLQIAAFETTNQWQEVKDRYFQLCRFYNAAGFADLIVRARVALEENGALVEHSFFIIDEYQDFNDAENQLITKLTEKANGLLIVGDDEQVLYEKLKCGDANLIRDLYKDQAFVNAMLPFCGRCSYHITKAADHFISASPDTERIKKIYLPIAQTGDGPKVQLVASATPSAAVDFIAKFVEEHRTLIEARARGLGEGTEKDAYLLILSPSRGAKFLGSKQSRDLLNLIEPFRSQAQSLSEHFYRVLTYHSVAMNPRPNFSFRKVMFFEGIPQDRAIELVDAAISNQLRLCEIDESEVRNILAKCDQVKSILEDSVDLSQILDQLQPLIPGLDRGILEADLKKEPIKGTELPLLELIADEDAELAETQATRMSAIELLTIVGAKGLSADHVILLGFDNVNMNYTTQNAFYVAITRARKSLHILTTLKAGGASAPHGFIDRLPTANVEFNSYRKTDRASTKYNSAQAFKDYISRLTTFRQRKV